MASTPEDGWFNEPDPSGRAAPVEDEWLAGEPQPARPAPFDPWSLANRRVLVPTGLALVFFVALLAAVGVFDSSSPAAPPPAATISTATPPVGQTTTPSAPRSTPTPPTTTLKPGDTGSQVKALQRELASLGYAIGTIDGDYGPTTTKAVTAFQRDHHLTPDGILGPSTLAALGP